MKKTEIRLQLLTKRRALTLAQRKQASQKIASILHQLSPVQAASKIGCYAARAGEVDLFPFIQQAWHLNKTIYLPVLDPKHPRSMWFSPYHPDTLLRLNRYEIAEPVANLNDEIPLRDLEIVLLPLVAFDESGHRLGMGAGYYDHCFSFRQHHPQGKPRLIGIAHGFQKVSSLPVDAWDVRLDGVVTERETIWF